MSLKCVTILRYGGQNIVRFRCWLLSVFSFILLCCVPQQSLATIITVTITGTVSEGTDLGIFAAPHTDLSGQPFTLTFTFDDTKGQETDTTCCAKPPVLAKTERSGSGSSSPGNAILQIGNVSYAFPASTSSDVYRSGGPIQSTAYLDVAVADAINDSDVFALVYPASGVLSNYVNWEASFSSTNLQEAGVYGFHISVLTSNGYISSGGELSASTITETGLATATNIYTPDQKAEFVATANWLNSLSGQLGIFASGCVPFAKLGWPAILCAASLGGNAGYAAVVAAKYSTLAQDPPDANFMQIATPIIPPYTPMPAQGFPIDFVNATNELRADLAQMYGIQVALITSINRLSGAQLANNAQWVELQESAVHNFNGQLSGYSARTAAATQSFENALGQFGAAYTTASDASVLETYIATNGLPPDIVSAITQFFGDQTDIANITNTIQTLNVNLISAPLAGTGSILDSTSSWLSSLSQSIGGTCTAVNTIKSTFGQRSGNPGFVSTVDINGDELINVVDLAMAARSLPAGTSCP